jgi:hypothetical protein
MIGIVGNGRDKFTDLGYQRATDTVKILVDSYPNEFIDSGDSPLDGIDKLARELTPKERFIGYYPEVHQWDNEHNNLKDIGACPIDHSKINLTSPRIHNCNNLVGYKSRNLEIAQSRKVIVIVADRYPEEYRGKHFFECYHCAKNPIRNSESFNHIKSGACWTAIKALEKGNEAEWIIVHNY